MQLDPKALEVAFRVNHHPDAEPSSVEIVQLSRSITAYLSTLSRDYEGLVAEWEKAAESVTPGPWSVNPNDERAILDSNEDPVVEVGGGPDDPHANSDAAWIARSSPAGILPLLSTVTALAAKAQSAQAGSDFWMAKAGDLAAKNAVLAAELETVKREREDTESRAQHAREQLDYAEEAQSDALDQVEALRREIAAERAAHAETRKALAWYGEQARLARLIHSGGDAGRRALAEDGGRRARALTQDGQHPEPTNGSFSAA